MTQRVQLSEGLRKRLSDKVVNGGNYFAKAKSDINFISSGCKVLDLALGGGWAERRITNIVGTQSAGKTLLAIEAAANFATKYPKGVIRYRESEAAFQRDYAAALGMPIKRVDFGDNKLETVEDFFEDLDYFSANAKGPELYICDSLDALSDRAEMGRDMSQGSYGAEKAKKMSQLFRRLVRKLDESHMTLIIISQVRDKIGAMFGPKTTRAGGRALDFYASQVIYVTTIGKITRVISNIKRPTGVKVLAKIEKNKIGLPFREAEFEISFGYGINDIWACLSWLKVGGFLDDLGLTDKSMKSYGRDLMESHNRPEIDRLHTVVEKRWYEIEKSFLPKRAKYQVAQP